jgi:hypothetical protein
MRCLYCGKELALLKRLRGGGDFCSDAHKQSYQEEYNRLALGRLLAHKKRPETNSSAAQNAPPAVTAPVAVAVKERAQRAQHDTESLIAEQSSLQPDGKAGQPQAAKERPGEPAGFLFESPTAAVPPEEAPYLAPWVELSPAPAIADGQIQNGAFSLSSAKLLSLHLRPHVSSIEHPALTPDLTPQEFVRAQPNPGPPLTAGAKKNERAKTFPAGGVVAIDIQPSSISCNADLGSVQAIAFESTILLDDPGLLELSPSTIDFPAEDSDVAVQPRRPAPVHLNPSEPSPEAPEEAPDDEGPQASLEALSRLHEELVELSAQEPKPRLATQLFEIPIKTFPPAKPALMGGDAFPSHTGPLLPHLKFLPLRPKIALASGSPVAPAAPAVSPQAPSNPAPAGEPPAGLTQPKLPVQAGKSPEARAPEAPKPLATPLADKPKPKPVQPKNDNVPSFDIAEPVTASGFGSLKVKLGIAIMLLVVACVYFLGWGGGKFHKPSGSNLVGATDGSGPNIIMGEGGWVEGWAGDPNAMHAGRQVTIYRPSLKLSDYRLEFQGAIEAKSIGWVFRAADPDNYYAMKLMDVSNGLSPKVALFKYLVVDGRQTQVGRVPIALAVQQDTVFDVRVDVRGPQFTTYLQGQQVDSWTDDQLKTGGAGFLNEREERGKVKSVAIRYLNGAASK